jgi:hypothetical protein
MLLLPRTRVLNFISEPFPTTARSGCMASKPSGHRQKPSWELNDLSSELLTLILEQVIPLLPVYFESAHAC